MTKPSRSRIAFPIAVLLVALTASCGGDVTLPDEGEAAELEILDGNGQVGPAGSALAEPLVVRVLDSENLPVPGQEVTFAIESGGGSVEPGTITTGNDGLATATWTLGPGAGGQQVGASTPSGGEGVLEVQFLATALAGSGSVLVGVSGDDQTGPVNSALADSLVVRTTDALGNPVANVEVTWSVSGGGSISPVTVVTGTDGLAAAERVLGPTAGEQSAQAAVEGFMGSPVTFSHTAEAADPFALVLVSGDDQSAPAGFEVAQDLVVRLEDPSGNGIGGQPIAWVVSPNMGSVSSGNSTTNANGLATTRWTLPNTVGEKSLSAVFSGLDPVVFTATATSAAPTTIEMVSGNGQSAAVGAGLTNPLVVRVTDANDNPVADVPVVWTAEGGGAVNGTATANTATDAQGLAQVTRTLGPTPGPYTTTAATDGLQGSPVTFVSTATVGAPAQLALIQQPGSPIVSGSQFQPSPIIEVRDAQGNQVPQGGIPVVVTITSGQVGATLENDSRNTNLNGRVTFSALRLSGPPDDDYVLTFTASFLGVPLTPVSTGPIVVTAGGAERLVLTQQPSASAQSGVQFPQQPVVQVVDGTGNPVEGNRTIEVEIEDGDGTLEGTLTASTGGGSTATFTNLAISGAVGSRTLLFSSGALTPVESNAINVTTGPATDMDIQAGDGQQAPVSTELPTDPAVIIRDSGGNPVPDVQVTFEVITGGGSVTPTPVATNASGIATTNWTLGAAAVPNQLRATSSVGEVTFNADATALGTTTELTVAPASPVEAGTEVTLTATVTGSGPAPAGDVDFFRDGPEPGSTLIGTATLSAGTATLPTSALPAGTYSITAVYEGDATYGGSTSAAVPYTVNEPSTPPTVGLDNFSVDEDGTLNQPAPGVLANDSDDDPLTALLAAGTSNGTLDLDADGSFTYTPNQDFNGTDQFTYRASDGEASSDLATVTIAVNPVNDEPAFTPGGDIEVTTLEALAFSAPWATGVDPGAPNEVTQDLEFTVTLNDPADDDAFLVAPQISDAGTLTFSSDVLVLTAPRVIPLTVVLVDGAGGSTVPVGFNIVINPPVGV